MDPLLMLIILFGIACMAIYYLAKAAVDHIFRVPED